MYNAGYVSREGMVCCGVCMLPEWMSVILVSHLDLLVSAATKVRKQEERICESFNQLPLVLLASIESDPPHYNERFVRALDADWFCVWYGGGAKGASFVFVDRCKELENSVRVIAE